MSMGVRLEPDKDTVALVRSTGELYAAWRHNPSTVRRVGMQDFISHSVVQYMVAQAYQAGMETGGRQLAQIKQILKD